MRFYGHNVMKFYGHNVMKFYGHNIMKFYGHESIRVYQVGLLTFSLSHPYIMYVRACV